MPTIEANFQTHLNGDALTVTSCVQIEQVNREPVVVAITKASQGHVTVQYPHTLVTGDTIIFRNVVGMTELNNVIATVTVTSTTEFDIDINTSGYTTYVSGGRVNTISGYTALDAPLTIGKVAYLASVGYTPSDVAKSGNLAVDNLDLIGIMNISGIDETALLSGFYDYCRIWLFIVNYKDLSLDPITVKYGRIGEASLGDVTFNAEFRGLSQALAQSTMRVYGPGCDAILGDSECGIDTSALAVSGTVTTVVNKRKFEDTALTQADNFFSLGKMVWKTGNNAGIQEDIRLYKLAGPTNPTVTLLDNLPFTIQVGDTFDLIQGCDGARDTCRDDYDNILKFRGFHDLPGLPEMMRYGSVQ